MDKNLAPKANVPQFCDMVVATRCVLKCRMCRAWQCGENADEITFDEAKRFVSGLAEFVKYPLEINVMGGEPFLKSWCLDLCNFIHENGFKSIISTNACLIDEDMAKKIADSKLSVLAISLESLKVQTHDFYRGVDGTLTKVMKAIEYLDKYCRGRLPITILAIIMEKNLDDIPELVEWVNRHGLFENISFLALQETGLVENRQDWFKKPQYAELWPQDVNKVHRLIDELIRLRGAGFRIWNPVSQLDAFKLYYTEPDKFMRETEYRIHDYIIDLDEKGTIYLSGETLGNVREYNLKQLWFSDKANQIRDKINRHGPGKRCCVINFVCAFPSDEEYARRKGDMYKDAERSSLKEQGK